MRGEDPKPPKKLDVIDESTMEEYTNAKVDIDTAE